ncbi:MAG: tripartite tricarboxylate transporter substrate binding protein [Oscillospiraceae bacterium]|nr:tripartite tricarboxylate transporter substrate binding protein [Oscillospiraceae bacterium]
MKRVLAAAATVIFILSLAACGGNGASGAYPSRDINGIVQWGAGGGTDSLMRPLASLAEKSLGKSIVIKNMTGATGSIAAQYVSDAPADGYNLLMGAENPALYDVLDISALTYDDFDCVYLIGDETVGIAVGKDSPYTSFGELVAAASAAPGTLKISTTGVGGLPWEVGAFIKDVTGAEFLQVPYDSDASAKMAVLGGECDLTVCKVQSGLEDYRAGELRFLCMFSSAPVSAMPDVAPVTVEYPDFEKYLPWGPFYGVFVKKGTDAAVIDALSRAFSEAGQDAGYQDMLAGFNVNFLGLTGDDAANYIASWREGTVGALRNSGAIS